MKISPSRQLPLVLLVLLSCSSFCLRADEKPTEPTPAVAAKQEERPSPERERRFDLSFPGGSPNELVAAISKAQGEPVNVLFGGPYERVQLPPIQVSQITCRELFAALNDSGQSMFNGLAFRIQNKPSEDTAGQARGQPSKLWTFTAMVVNMDSETRTFFFQLAPYLEAGLTVDDITTAIETAWKMQALKVRPQLCFHKETKLLIAVGRESEIWTVRGALAALPKKEDPKVAKAAEASSSPFK